MSNRYAIQGVISKRESQVLKLLADEYTTREIASHLYISVETASSHRKNLLSKLGSKNVAGLIRRAFELRILTIN